MFYSLKLNAYGKGNKQEKQEKRKNGEIVW